MLKKLNEHPKNKIVIAFIFIIMAIAIFFLNYFFPLYADDMSYASIKFDQKIDLLNNLRDISNFMYNYYFNWGGRIIGIGSTHFLLLLPDLLQNILNTILFITLIYYMYKIAITSYSSNKITTLLVIILSTFYFSPTFISSCIWITGSGVFLLTTTLSVIFLYIYIKNINGKYNNHAKKNIIIIFLLGILSGLSNENTGPMLCLTILIFLIYKHFFQKRKLSPYDITGFVALLIGTSLMIFAPGNSMRAASEGYDSLFSKIDILPKLKYLYEGYSMYLWKIILAYLLIFVIHLLSTKNISLKKTIIIKSLIVFTCANIGFWITALAPSFPPRAYFSIIVFITIAFSILLVNIDFNQIYTKYLRITLLTILFIVSAKDYYIFLRASYFIDKVYKDREQQIIKAKENGEQEITFTPIQVDYRMNYTDFSNFYEDYYQIKVHFIEPQQ